MKWTRESRAHKRKGIAPCHVANSRVMPMEYRVYQIKQYKYEAWIFTRVDKPSNMFMDRMTPMRLKTPDHRLIMSLSEAKEECERAESQLVMLYREARSGS